ncbi:methionine--tRNA ligase [Candidatus Saccharibacteria bacterium]|nr:methionine--tRNA ligase [Candidatus Saccharibacteria bacterium]
MTKPYLTTAIPYVNGAPHIGHALDSLLADTFFRYQALKGNDVRFQAGTDEHGNKIFAKAASLGLDPQAYVDENAQKFRDFIARLGVHPTDFIRTTDPDHERRCQKIWLKLKPHIYSASYEGWYCQGCERFVTDKEVEDNAGLCPDHQSPYERLSETNYYLRIADFRDEIARRIESDELHILPDFRKKEILHLLEDTPDVSISRPKKNLSWGVPVPDDDDQVMYVWIDALANYITVLGYPDRDISDYWPATLQIVGKDILRFHAIIWPAMLLALDLPLPRTLLSHGFINNNGQKMSKSLGNVVDPLEVLDRHGRDAFRYFFLRHIDTFDDSDFSYEKFDTAYNTELANDLGNLVQRLATLCAKNNLTYVVKNTTFSPAYDQAFAEYNLNLAFEHAWAHVQALNRRIDEEKPWELAKQGKTAELTAVLSSLVDDLLHANLELTPFLPDATERIRTIFTAEKITPPSTPLFPKSA